MVWKLLRKNISVGQIAGYALANLVGLAIVLTAIRFYSDVSATFQDEDSFVRTDYLIISKPVRLAAVLGSNRSASFTDADVSQLRQQPWVKRVGKFQPANFDVSASVEMAGRHMSTAMFFEAIPDEFYDVKPDEWQWSPGQTDIPVILSKDYLALYNFGFAAPRGMPQLSEDLITKIPLTIHIVGNGQYAQFTAHIVGFSSRLNTIAVPQSFMDWANRRYTDPQRAAENSSRLIVEVNSPGDPAIQQYFDANGIEVAGDRGNNSRTIYLMTVITTIVVVVGIIICILAFFILMLSIYLLIQKSRDKLRDLMLLGYSPGQICRCYYRLVGLVNLGILLAATGIMLAAAHLWRPSLEALDISTGSSAPALLWGAALMTAVTALNFLTIRRLVRRCF